MVLMELKTCRIGKISQQAEAVFNKILGPRKKKLPRVDQYASRIPKNVLHEILATRAWKGLAS